MLHNTSEKDITDYRVVEAKIDEKGEAIRDNHGNIVSTGRTLEWSLKAGEKLEFPVYVADYLSEVYPFLEKIEASEERPEKVETNEEVSSSTADTKEPVINYTAMATEANVNCKFCGSHFRSVKGLGLHIAHAHPEKILS